MKTFCRPGGTAARERVGATSPDSRGGKAFSLLELLVAAALLALIGILIAQVTVAISRATRLSNQGVDAAAQARLAFDRFGADLADSPLRTDVDFAASNPLASGDPFLLFLSAVPSSGTNANRMISLVSYRVAPGTDNKDANGVARKCLQRAGKALQWGDSGFMGLHPNTLLPISFSDPAYPSLPASGDYDILSPAVIHAVVGFQLRPDDLPVLLADGTSLPNARGQIVYSPPVRGTNSPASSYVDPARIGSLIVGLVVIDPERLKLLDAGAIDTLAAAFSQTPDPGQLPVARWMEDTDHLASLPASVPLPARQSVRLYQRSFPLTPP